MSVQQILSQLEGKDEEACLHIAQRVGSHLCDEVLPQADRRAAELLARALADEAIESVRSELSKAIARARHLPRDLALKLAHDVDSVSCPFLEATEVFSDSDWQQLLLTITRGARNAVAKRASMSEELAGALAQIGESMVAETLIENPAAPMTRSICYTLMDRFSSEIWVLDKLAQRSDLISEIAMKLTTIVSAVAREKLRKVYNLPELTAPLAAEAETGALLQVARKTHSSDMMITAETLKKKGKLDPPLVFKALQNGQLDFLEAALSVLAERSIEHVRSVVLRAGEDAVRQLLFRATIPDDLHRKFWDELESFRQKQK
jgi:uncharacterized protein (DUF2336 family)